MKFLEKNILFCRFCAKPLEQTFIDLGMSPIANAYIKLQDQEKMEPFYPLHTYVCKHCFLVQLPSSIAREIIFNNEYAYFSSYSDSWLDHVKRYVQEITDRFSFSNKSLVVELASNDGYLLQYFKEKSLPVLGIEPCANVAHIAQKKGIETLIEFFGIAMAKRMAKLGQKADLIIGNNVLAHVPDVNDFVAGMKIILKPKGIITIEFPHLLKLMQHNEFDTIYHEHYSYYSFTTVEKIFAQQGLTLFDVQEIQTHGGSLRIFGRHKENKSLAVSSRVSALKTQEKKFGLQKLSTYKQFEEQVKETKRALLELLTKLKRQGKTIVGYGAPAKGNTLLNFCGIRQDFLDYTADRSLAKQDHLLPGTRIPIFAPEKIKETKPDYILILPWNLRDEIMNQLAFVKQWGGKFIVPVPKATIL